MNRFDLVRLINDIPYKNLDLMKDLHGIVLELDNDFVKVMFFNPQNIGQYVVAILIKLI